MGSNTRMQPQRRRVSLTRRRANMTCNLDRTAFLACRVRGAFLRGGIPRLRRVEHDSALFSLRAPFGDTIRVPSEYVSRGATKQCRASDAWSRDIASRLKTLRLSIGD